jgi:hypothetical protein
MVHRKAIGVDERGLVLDRILQASQAQTTQKIMPSPILSRSAAEGPESDQVFAEMMPSFSEPERKPLGSICTEPKPMRLSSWTMIP